MGIWEEYCFACGGSFMMNTGWMTNIVGWTFPNEMIKLVSYNDDGTFTGEDKKIYGSKSHERGNISNIGRYSPKIFCIAFHRDCLKFVKKLSSRLTIDDLWEIERDSNNLPPKNYGEMAKYMGQFFEYDQPIEDGNEWLLESPLKNKRNAERIQKIWRKITKEI